MGLRTRPFNYFLLKRTGTEPRPTIKRLFNEVSYTWIQLK